MKEENIFNEIAKKEMINWNLNDFKKSHPRLFKVIIESMKANAGGQPEQLACGDAIKHNYSMHKIGRCIPCDRNAS